jgi:dihydrofolate synthase/folylpolyglutamate synthase
MLADKAVDEVVTIISPIADAWYTAGLETESRGLSANGMAEVVSLVAHKRADVKLCPQTTVESAIAVAMAEAHKQDCIVVLGSFFTVAAAANYFLSPESVT